MKISLTHSGLYSIASGIILMAALFSCRQKQNTQVTNKADNASAEIPDTPYGDSVRYGRDLIVNTALYFGPKGKLGNISNGMNCQNCHLQAGTVLFANPFFGVRHNYPKYRDRSGRIESIEFRVNDCMERSMNGSKIDSASKEMQSIVAYLKWVSRDSLRTEIISGLGTGQLPYLDRPADPEKGAIIFSAKCALCHGSNGEGRLYESYDRYVYPPLWGPKSFNVSAGIFRLSKLAAFIKNNMPYGSKYNKTILKNEEAWDVAAFIASKNRTEKRFANDYALLKKKPVDYPFGPYADTFSERQHKYGPFAAIEKYHSERKDYGTIVKK